MNRRFVIITSLCLALFLSLSKQGFTQEREVTSRDLEGAPTSHRYFWSVLGGTALGAGLGLIAPGGTKSAFKGVMLGGSLTSAFYLAKNPRAAGNARPFAHILTNATLGSGLLWTFCNCSTGGWTGGLIGGGGTALFQALGTHNSTMSTLTSSSAPPQSAPEATPDSQSKIGRQNVLDNKRPDNAGKPSGPFDQPHEQEQ